jgi:hypothetical protein
MSLTYNRTYDAETVKSHQEGIMIWSNAPRNVHRDRFDKINAALAPRDMQVRKRLGGMTAPNQFAIFLDDKRLTRWASLKRVILLAREKWM